MPLMTKFSQISFTDSVKPRSNISKETAEVDQRDTVSLFSDLQLTLKNVLLSLTVLSLRAEKFLPDQIRVIPPRPPSQKRNQEPPKVSEVEPEAEEKEVEEEDPTEFKVEIPLRNPQL